MGFFLKKLISAFLLPLPLAVLVLGLGFGLLWFSKRQKAGKIVATVGFGLLLLFSYGFVADGIVGPLESVPPLQPQAGIAAGRTPRWIVVLGSGHGYHPQLPATAQLDAGALARLVEAVRLYREIPGTRLLVSGAPGAPIKHGEVLAAAARILGVPAGDVVADVSAWDTHDEARALSARVGGDDFILVTSASHMRRALRLFRAQGKQPIPAPTNYVGSDPPGVHLGDFFPTPAALDVNARAFHEYLGFLWSRVRGQL